MKFAESTKKRGIIADSANYALKITNFAESSVKSAESAIRFCEIAESSTIFAKLSQKNIHKARNDTF